jgi:hypothetical protein
MDREFDTTSPLQLTYVVRKFSMMSAKQKAFALYIPCREVGKHCLTNFVILLILITICLDKSRYVCTLLVGHHVLFRDFGPYAIMFVCVLL